MNQNGRIIELTAEQVDEIQYNLYEYDTDYVTYRLNGSVQIGIELNGKLIAGLNAYMSSFKILYVATVFVDAKYRKKGYGKVLIQEMEKRAKKLGANTIRLDTFNWQGTDFYKALGYEEVGHYVNEEEHYEESFFLKRI